MKKITAKIMIKTEQGYKPIEKASDEEIEKYRQAIKTKAERILSEVIK